MTGVATHRELMMIDLLEAIEGAGGPVPDDELSYRAALTAEECHSLILEAEQAGLVRPSPAGWVIQRAGVDYTDPAEYTES